ncbi:hypothetical protein [Leucobacter sp. CX169]|uniref:hypothetical protein n=1 Tax=Leucobacter sp. CX169 TaxID=2813744 RepID=UPI0019A39556|nr:hypothetical protein [Leucobacter sp. CX169]MBC9927485.1 hypothetical protein [Leucobacter sp. cx-169]
MHVSHRPSRARPAWALIAILVIVGTLIAVYGIALAKSSYKSLTAAEKTTE